MHVYAPMKEHAGLFNRIDGKETFVEVGRLDALGGILAPFDTLAKPSRERERPR